MHKILKALTQLGFWLMPHHLLSALVGALARSKQPWFKNRVIAWFIKRYQVNLEDALIENQEDFSCFQAFFTRALKPDARVIDPTRDGIISPVDGSVCDFGDIQLNTLLNIKGEDYSINELIGDNHHQFNYYASFYLAPQNYHRVHMPFDGELISARYIPGRLFSVSPSLAQPHVFKRNERVVAFFETDKGPMAVILIGAFFVGGIVLEWHGNVRDEPKPNTPEALWLALNKPKWQQKLAGIKKACGQQNIRDWHYQDKIHFAKGEMLGYFEMGSAVITLMQNPVLNWSSDLNKMQAIKMGQLLASY